MERIFGISNGMGKVKSEQVLRVRLYAHGRRIYGSPSTEDTLHNVITKEELINLIFAFGSSNSKLKPFSIIVVTFWVICKRQKRKQRIFIFHNSDFMTLEIINLIEKSKV